MVGRDTGYDGKRWREARVSPEARVLGFVILMVAIFLGAYKAGAFVGPVIPAHSVISTPGGGQAPGMNMGALGAGGRDSSMTRRHR
jgi:hypothetical protein